MAKTHKRVLSLILSLVMVLSLLPIQALAAVSISCTASDGAVITITGDIPETAAVTAVPVPVELEGMKTLGAYDINITVDGLAWQPESPVEVNIESPAFEGYEELSVFHVDTDQALDYIDQYFGFLEQIMNFLKGLFSRKISSDVVSFMAEHFSIYAVGAPYVATYQFYDGPAGTGKLIDSATQILKNGEPVQLPAAPAGDGIFQGWYIDDTPVDGSYRVPVLSADVTYDVYPQFAGVYYVTFYDTTGSTVVATIPVDTNGSAVVGDTINTVEPILEAGKILVGWSTTPGNATADFTADTPVTGNTSVYPVLKDGVVVTFDSQGGSPSVTTVTAEADGTVVPPSDPTRSGFHFDGWYTGPTGGDKVGFDSYRPAANATLYAHWTASDTTYTIQYWAENADDDEYTYAAAETVNGTAGAAISLTDGQKNPNKLGRTDSAGFTYSHNDSEGKTVAGDGTTIVNVYFDRNTYTVKFWVQGSPQPTCGLEEHTHSWRQGCYKLDCDKWFMHSHNESCYDKDVVVCGKVEHTHAAACYGGVETDGGWYVWKAVTAKYGAYIGNQWPGSNWAIGKNSSTSQSFLSVMPLGGDDFYWRNSGTPGSTGSDQSSADYYVEALPGTVGTAQFEGKSFVWHHEDSARSSGLSTTEEDFYDIAGFNQYKYTSGKQTYSYGNWGHSYDGAKFYYTRNSYTIDFYVDGDNKDSASVAYETAIGSTLDAKKPTTPPQQGYTFAGWYLDPECETPVPVDMTMSDGNLAVYGQWVPPVVKVNVYYTTASGQAVSAGTFNFGHVLLATDLEDVVKTAASATGHDVADFLGWYVQSGTGYAAYTFGSALASDVTLYARWRGDTYTVTYQGSEGGSYADSGKYALGSEAKALTFAATGLTAPEGKEFSHWETADGTQVKPGETLSISGNVTLTAVYVNEVDVPTVTVTYNANGGEGTMDPQTVKLNDKFTVAGCGFTNPGYRFIGWATEKGPVAEKDLIQPDKEMRADNEGVNILYAQWEQAVFNITYELDGGTNAASNPKTYTYGVGVASFAPATKTGYTFQGWYSDDDFTTQVTSIGTNESGDKTLYAKWEINTYTVTYDGNGATSGSVTDLSSPYNYQSTVTVLGQGNLEKTGYKFTGWNTQADGTGDAYTAGYSFAIEADITLYAQWVIDPEQTQDLKATVDYKLGDEVQTADHIDLKATVQVLEPDTLSTEGVTAKTYTGWKLDNITINGEEVESLPETVKNGDAVVYNYSVDEDQTKNLKATVDYKLGDEVQAADHKDLTATVQVLEPDTLSTEGVTAKTYTGWKLDNITINGEVVESLPAMVNNGDAVVYNYVVDEGQTKDLSATVDYKLGENVQTRDHIDLKATVQVLEPDTLSTEGVTAKTYKGWKLDNITINGEVVESLPGTVNDGDAVVYNYVADLSVTKTLSYTVEYYKDGVKVEVDTETVKEKVWINSTQTTLTVDKNNINTTDKYEGFALDYTDPAVIPETINDGSTIKVYYAKDEKGGGDDGDEGDGIPDKYQVFVKYEATEGGSLSGTTYEAYDLRDAEGMATSVTLTFPTPVAETNYVFDGWTNPAGVTVEGTTMSGFVVETTYTFTANFAKDDLVDPTEDEDPDKPGDGIADKYQVVVNYRAINGTVSFGSTVVTKKDTNGNPAADGTAKLAEAHIPTATPIAGYVAAGNLWTPVTPKVDLPVVDGQTFTANYVYIPPYIPPTDPGTDIDDEDVPLADLPGLNTVDHYAYIAGYEDGTVRPNNNITRAEVATIFFRLFTDEYRETFWSTTNPFSDVAYTAWYNNAVSTTSNAGIIAGYPDGTFLPNNYITRAEFATIAARFLSGEYVGPDLFTDISGHWAAEYINRAANAGWINGYPDGSFRPNAYITRAEAMTLVNSMLGRMPHKDHMLENMVKWPDNPEAAWYYEAVQEATNGHDYDWYEEEDQVFYEIWTALQPNRDWAALEKEWSNAYSAPGGEVDG